MKPVVVVVVVAVTVAVAPGRHRRRRRRRRRRHRRRCHYQLNTQSQRLFGCLNIWPTCDLALKLARETTRRRPVGSVPRSGKKVVYTGKSGMHTTSDYSQQTF